MVPWGDVTQAVMYHQVRKYLLKMQGDMGGIKYWRLSLLVLVDMTRNNMIILRFCNLLKKGGLMCIGTVIDGTWEEPEVCIDARQRGIAAIESESSSLQLKAFAEVAVAPSVRHGAA